MMNSILFQRETRNCMKTKERKMKAIVQLFLLLVIATLVTGKNIPKTADDLGLPVDDSDSDSLPAEVENDPERASFDTTLTDLDFPYDEENDPGSG